VIRTQQLHVSHNTQLNTEQHTHTHRVVKEYSAKMMGTRGFLLLPDDTHSTNKFSMILRWMNHHL